MPVKKRKYTAKQPRRKRLPFKKRPLRPDQLTMRQMKAPDPKLICKCNYNSFTGSSAPTGAVMTPALTNALNDTYCQAINLVSQGTSFNNRIGNKIAMIRLEIHYWFWYSGVVVIEPDTVRVCVVYDKTPNYVNNVKWADVFQDVDSNGTTIDGPTVGTNWRTRNRFRVLMNNHHNLPNVDATSANAPKAIQDFSKPFYTREFIDLRRTTVWGANSGLAVPSDIESGALWLMVQGTFPPGAGGYNLYYSTRITFFDV